MPVWYLWWSLTTTFSRPATVTISISTRTISCFVHTRTDFPRARAYWPRIWLSSINTWPIRASGFSLPGRPLSQSLNATINTNTVSAFVDFYFILDRQLSVTVWYNVNYAPDLFRFSVGMSIFIISYRSNMR